MDIHISQEVLDEYPNAYVHIENVNAFLDDIEATEKDIKNIDIELKFAQPDGYPKYTDPETPESTITQIGGPLHTYSLDRPYWPQGIKVSSIAKIPTEDAPLSFWGQFEEMPKKDVAEIITGRQILNSLLVGIDANHRNRLYYANAAKRYNRMIVATGAISIGLAMGVMSQVPASNEIGRAVISCGGFAPIMIAAARGQKKLGEAVVPDDFDFFLLSQSQEQTVQDYQHDIFSLDKD